MKQVLSNYEISEIVTSLCKVEDSYFSFALARKVEEEVLKKVNQKEVIAVSGVFPAVFTKVDIDSQ